jgi:DNA-binding MarR family transcriptional regulator
MAPVARAVPPKPSAPKPAAPAKPGAARPDDTAGLVADTAGLAARLRLAVARLHRRVRHEGTVAGEELTASSMAALATIEAAGPITLGELAAVEHVQPPSMTRIVARLEEQGYATRDVDPRDRRVARAAITTSGRRFLARGRTRRDAFLSRRIAALPADDQAALARALPVIEQLLVDDA